MGGLEDNDVKTLELINLSKKGDKEAQNALVEKNIGLVWSVVRRFQNRGYETDDLFQIGCIGLIKAIKKFNTSYDVKFSTYAVPMIIGEIKRFIRDDGIIKVSRSLKELSSKARITQEILTRELGREPTLSELSAKLDVTVEELVMAMDSACSPESLYSSVAEGDSNTLLLIDKLQSQTEDKEGDIIDRLALKQILDSLKPREKQIIVLRYFKDKTQAQIAQMLGISQVQVSRLEKKILREIKQKINYG